MSNDPDVVLYTYFRSSSAWRVRNLLNVKKIEHKLVPVHLVKGGQHDPEYVKLNPSHSVPTVVADGHVMSQSVSIMEYLDETRPAVPLLPKDAFLRQQVRQVVNMIVADTQPVANLRVLKKLGDDKRDEWAHYWINWNFQALEQVLQQTSGKYCVGDELSLADCVLVPQVYNAIRFKVDLSAFPTITRLNKDLLTIPEFLAAHASNQADCPPELRSEGL